MSKAKKIFLILVVVVVLAIVTVLAVTSRASSPVPAPQLQYSEEQASERLETLKAAQNRHVVEVVPMKFFINEIRCGDGTFSVTAVTTMRVEDIAAVSFRATNSAVPSAEIWYDAEDLGSGRYMLNGSAVDLGRRSGTYTIEAFITPVGGGETEAGSTELKMDLENYFYSEALGNGRQSLVLVGPKAETVSEVAGVMFKVWTVEDDQDDIKRVMAKEDPEGVWTAEIDVHDFDDRGDFIANAYALSAEEMEKMPAESTEDEVKETSAESVAEETKETSAESAAEETKETSAESAAEETKETSAESAAEETKETSAESAAEETKETSAESAAEETTETSAESAAEETKETSAESTAEETKETSAESAAEETKETSAESVEETKETSEVSTSEETKEGPKEGEDKAEDEDIMGAGTGIASERFELLPDPSELPKGTGEVVKEGKRVYVKVPELLQTPELPTGCESVALTIVLQSLGYDLEKTEIAKNYLERGTDMATSYVGDPFSKNGAGCFPPAIVNAANKYLGEQKDARTARNITGESIDDLCDYIDGGIPVILWSSMYMADPAKTGGSYTYQGQSYQWYRSEHCVVLYGYDKEKDVYLVSDPLNGYVERNASAFQNIYDSIGKYAVVIY